MDVTTQSVAPSIVVTLSADEAKKLRRVCYYNKTVASKYSGNPVGGEIKATAVKDFLSILGAKLKANGIDRF